MTRLREQYETAIRPELQKQFGYKSSMEIPRLDKIVLNMGVGEASQDRKKIDGALSDLTLITGQRPVATKSKKSIAAFKLRDGLVIGAKVTLRKERMYEFLDRLVNIALPRVRDFRGLNPKSFDGHGNYSLGLKEQIVFPEIDYDKVDKVRGMDIIICTTAKSDDEAHALLSRFDFPFTGETVEEKKKANEAALAAESAPAAENNQGAGDETDTAGNGEKQNG